MSETTVRRERESAEAHLLAAAEYIAKGDQFYAKAADELIAAKVGAKNGPSYTDAARRVGKSADWVTALVTSRTNFRAGSDEDEFRVDWRRGSHGTRAEFDRTVAEQPERVAEAFEKAPPEARQQIAERLSQAPEVRIETRKRDVEQAERRQPSPVKPRTDHNLYEFESRLVSARRDLREALALVDRIDSTGDDQDILDLLGMLEGLLSATAEAYRSGKSIDTWAWELYERSAG